MLLATNGLLDNTALEINSGLVANIQSYENTPAIAAFSSVIANASGVVANSTLANLQQVGSTDLPAITNTVPSQYMGFITIGNVSVLANSYPDGFTGAISNRANTIMGNGDLSLFAQIYQTSVTYLGQSNEILSTAQNAGAINATFISMDDLSTGGLSDVSTDLPALGDDLTDLGYAIDLAELTLLGFPSTLLRQTIIRGNGGITPALKSQLELNGITSIDLLTLTAFDAPEIVGSQELAIYQAMQNIKGNDLAQILTILDVSTPGLDSMADLLDPVKIFPRSYLTLTVPPQQTTDTALASSSIYVQAATVNNQLAQVFGIDGACQIRNKIMPADQALAIQAIGRSLQSIQNISALQLPDLAAAVSATETFDDLPLIQQQNTAVSSTTVDDLIEELAPTLEYANISIPVSTGNCNNFVVYDFVGTAAGYPHSAQLANVTIYIGEMASAGELDTLIDPSTGAYAAMESVLAGNLTLVPPWGSGVYANIDVAMDAVIANTNLAIGNIAASSIFTTVLNQSWANMAEQLIREEYNQQSSNVELDTLAGNSLPNVMSLAVQLHDIGLQTCFQDANDFFVAVANTNNQGGQAVIASLREGRNIAALENSGIGVNALLPQPDPADCGACSQQDIFDI